MKIPCFLKYTSKLLLIPLCLLSPSQSLSQEIIAHLETQRDSLSLGTLRAIFSMRKRNWEEQKPITVFVLRDESPIHKEFSKRSLQLFPYQLRKTWDRLVFSGTGQAPIEVNSTEEMLQRVSTTIGAIGYMEADLIDSSKVLQIKVK